MSKNAVCLLLLACLMAGCGEGNTSRRAQPIARTSAGLLAPDPSGRPLITQPMPMQARPVASLGQQLNYQPANKQAKTAEPAESLGPSQVTLIYPSPEYGVLKVDKVIPREVDLNVQFKYSLIITNLTNASLANLIISETLAPTFQFKGATPTPQQAANNQLIWRLEALGPKASERFEISGIPSRLDTLTHATNITYAMATASTIRVVQSTLELVRKVPMEALLGEPITAEYTVTNTGSGTAQDVRIVEQLPTGLTTTDGRNEIRIDVGQLRPGQARTFGVQLQATKPGTFTGQAKVLSSSNAQAQSAMGQVTVRTPLLTIERKGPERIYLGRPISYQLTVSNQGDGPANKTVLEEVLPADAQDITCDPPADISGARLVWNLGTIPAKGSRGVQVSFKPATTGIVTTTSTAKAMFTEKTAISVRTAVLGVPAIRLDVVDLEDPAEVNGQVTYVITITNEGSASDHNLQLICELDDKLTYISSTGPTKVGSIGKTITFGQLRSIGPKEKVSWRVMTRCASAGRVWFKASLTSETITRPLEKTEATFIYQ